MGKSWSPDRAFLERMLALIEWAHQHPDCPAPFEDNDWPMFVQWMSDTLKEADDG